MSSKPPTLAGFDVGGTTARVTFFDDDHTPLATARERIREDTSPEAVADAMARLLATACDEIACAPDALDAIGAGMAAQLLSDGRTVVNAPNLGWRDLDFASLLEDRLSAPVHLANDLNAMVWGERAAGAARGATDVLAVYVGTGVGGGIICGGKLVDGGGGKGGEIGHVKVAYGDDARLCGCGEYGCLEAYVGGVHLEAQLMTMSELSGGADLLDARGRGDIAKADALSPTYAEVGALWSRSVALLGDAIANACTLLNPDVLLLGGGVLENAPNLREGVEKRVLARTLAAARADLTIARPELGDVAGMLGAALLARELRG